jgi:hypothetical protein
MDKAVHYPQMPPLLAGETDVDYTGRLIGASGHESPYDHRRNRQCSIGWHSECSDPDGESCECPHHRDQRVAAGLPHVIGTIKAAMREGLGEHIGPGIVELSAADVVIDILADTDEPLRGLIERWRDSGDEQRAACADELAAVLEARRVA